MTLEELRASEKLTLSPDEAASVLGCRAQYLRVAARDHPEQLGFPVCVVRRQVRIPRLPLLHFLEG